MVKRLSVSTLRWRNEYFLFLLPIFFVLHAFNEHYGKIPVGEIFLVLLKYILAEVVLLVVFSLVLRSMRKAAVFTFALFSVFFFYGALHDWLKEVATGRFISSYSFILAFLSVLFITVFIYLIKSKQGFYRLVTYLNVLFFVLVTVELGTLLFKKPLFAGIIEQATSNSSPAQQLQPCDSCPKEDIHLIILDEYAGERQLKEAFHYDNSAFSDTLSSRGFHVISQPRSNYKNTDISVASLLSMDYLGDLSDKNQNELYHIGSSVINRNVFTSYLSRLGYQVNNFSIFDVSGSPARYSPYKPTVNLVTERTLLGRLKRDLGFHLYFTLQLDFAVNDLKQYVEKDAARNGHTMTTVVNAVERKTVVPQFYYTHLLMPHDPFYFDKDGRFTGVQQYLAHKTPEQARKYYLEYLQYTNGKVLSFVDSILQKSTRPPVILLMGDHGYRHPAMERKYQFSTLNAVYFPDRKYQGFYVGMSHVNQLRVFLNTRFGQNLPLLKDTCIFLL